MKLGEALSLRARQAQQMKDLQTRIVKNAQKEKGEPVTEDANALIEAYCRLSNEHDELVYRIHLSNATTSVDGTPLLKLLQDRDDLIRQRNIYQVAADAATPTRERYYGGGEKTYEPAVDVRHYREIVETTNEAIRQLDSQIQEVNWRTDLLG